MNQKYPRLPHLPNSPGGTADDERLVNLDALCGPEIIITEKLDGSNIGFTSDAIFARSHWGPPTHRSFDRAKSLWASLRHRLPAGVTVFGEWVYAKHSVLYTALPGYCFIFDVRDEETGGWRSWPEVEALAASLELPAAPALWAGKIADARALLAVAARLARQPSCYGDAREGVVIRRASRISAAARPASIAKWVRAGHVQSDEHWLTRPVIRNRLRT